MPRKSVLLAEDRPGTRNAVKAALRVRGFIVTAVEDGSLALEAAQSQRFDIVVADREMPNMNGVELMNKLRRMPGSRNTIFIMFSGDPEGYGDVLPKWVIHVPKPRLPALLRALGDEAPW